MNVLQFHGNIWKYFGNVIEKEGVLILKCSVSFIDLVQLIHLSPSDESWD